MYIILGYKLLLSHISFKPTILKMISYLIAAYTICGEMQPPPIANTVFEEDEKLSLSRDGNISRRTF